MTGIPADLAASLADRYQLTSVLGAGGMATVYLAHDLRHDRQVALKVLRPDLASRLGPERFLAEIRATARLRHPGIAPLFDSGDADGMLFYVMPLITGVSLREHLQHEGALVTAEALRIVDEVADALAYAHRGGVIHRDVKPENILLEGGHAVLTDFGIARVIREAVDVRLTQDGHAMGTPMYMSPEQAAGETDIDGRSDLYNLASVLFEMLVGTPPFTGTSAEAVIAKRFTTIAPRVSSQRADISPHIDRAIHRALTRDPNDRHATVEAFAAALRASPIRTAAEVSRSIAVLPFENVSADPQNAFLADGIAEEIINALTQMDGLRIAARTSSFTFRGRQAELREIGERLNVATVLQGSVRKVGSRLRITAQLISVDDGFQLWSERYDRDLTDVFAVQDEIAGAIATRLAVRLTKPLDDRAARPTTANMAAYELYLKGRALIAKRGLRVSEGIRLVERAIALEPDYAPAHAALGDGLRQQVALDNESVAGTMDRAKAALQRALELEPNLGEAIGVLGTIALLFDRDADKGFEYWDRALVLNPTLSETRVNRAGWGLAVLRGDFEQALAEADRAAAVDPMSAVVESYRAIMLALSGRAHAARAAVEHAMTLDGESYLARLIAVSVFRWTGDIDRALNESRVALRMSGRATPSLAEMSGLYAAKGDYRRASAAHAELRARSVLDAVDLTFLAISASGAGEVDEAMSYAMRAVEQRSPNQLWLIRRPGLEALQAHPRYAELRSLMGL